MEINPLDVVVVVEDDEPYSLYQSGINGEPEILPRVGDEYQADLPGLVSRNDRLNLAKWFESENVITFGLPVPLMWTRSEKFKGFHEEIKNDKQELDPRKDDDNTRRSSSGVVLALPCQRNVKFKFEWLDKCLYPFPGTLGESWEDCEKEWFLLGLYCLGKNLVLVQRFVGSKKMGDLLSYYYGSFYRSNEYRRWFEGRKFRSKRSVQGQKLFTGLRLQELISRISSSVSEECKSMLVKVSKEFREDKIVIEEFVFALKETVGLDLLTEAIGIGKGKKDLTNSALEPAKMNNRSNNSEVVRIGNDLPLSDIVKFLNGEYRMSKTKSNDLFWEAVWPRLLARGWHSEQPKDAPKDSLVFLIPEAIKFSRRKMSKGKHYFESSKDVLDKVKLDPTLLVLETDNKEESKEAKKDIKKQYLQPQSKPSKSSSQEVTMFTIVDSSKANGVKKVRSLPVEIGSSTQSYLSEESEEDDSSEESESNKVETTMASRVCGGGSISSVNMENATSRSTISLNEKQQPKKKNKGGRPRNPVFTKKRSSLADCTLRESVSFGEAQFQKKKMKPVKKKMKPNPSEDQTLKLSSEDDSSCRRKHQEEEEGEEERVISSSSSPERKPEKAREDFDLNVPQFDEADAGTVTVITDVKQNSENSCAEQSSVQMDVETKQETVEDLLPERRQSTRTRPLTTRALEAIAFGYLGNSKKKRKDSEDEPRYKSRRTKSTKRNNRYSEFRNGTVEDGSNTDDE